jgi:Peptidase family M28
MIRKNYFKKITLAFTLSACMQLSFGQQIIDRDPLIEKMVNEVSSDSLKTYVEKLVSFGTRSTLSSTTDKKRGIGPAREWILQKFEQFSRHSNGRLTAVLDTITLPADKRRLDVPTNIGNVVATLKGTDPSDNRVFMISGHLDSRSTNVMNRTNDAPGANDDGSGVAAVLESARIMSRQNFPATIIFVAFSGEEQGLLGAEYLATKMRAENIALEALFNNDIMGSNHSNGTNIINNTMVRVFSEGLPAFETDKKAGMIRSFGLENDGAPRQLARYIKEVGERYVDNLEVKLIYRSDRYLRGGDQTPFLQKGFTAIRISEMNENFDHQHQDLRTENNIIYGDLTVFMDFEYLRKNTALNLSCLANLAKSPAKPETVKMEVKNLSNFTSLSWKGLPANSARGFYVLIRESSSPVWQKKIFTSQNTISLPYSKDNYVFAVQSVSNNNNESLPVLPTADR